jgi:hypothetical protein
MIRNPQNSGVSVNKIGGKRGEVKRILWIRELGN